MLADGLHAALRFGHYAVLLGLFGATTFRVTGLRHLAAAADRKPLKFLTLAAVAAPVVSVALLLVGIAAMMGQPVRNLEWPTIGSIMVTTDMGWAFLVRMIVLAAGLGALLWVEPTRARLTLAASCYAIALLTLAWNGHAAATEGAIGLLHRLNNGVHLLAAGLWIGAIGWFAALVLAAHRTMDRLTVVPLMKAMHDFAPFGFALVVTVAVTGIINAQLVVGLINSLEVLGTPYGSLLAAKVAAVMLMVVCAVHNAIAVRRDSKDAETWPNRATSQLAALRRSLATELLLALGVLLLVAFTGLASPLG